jgi:hypothetical protein
MHGAVQGLRTDREKCIVRTITKQAITNQADTNAADTHAAEEGRHPKSRRSERPDERLVARHLKTSPSECLKGERP